MVSGADLMPTFLELAGTQMPGYADGRSLVLLLTGSDPSWRDALVLEGCDDRFGNKPYAPPDFEATRTAEGRTYVEYETGERGLYDLRTDPRQLRELARGARTHPGGSSAFGLLASPEVLLRQRVPGRREKTKPRSPRAPIFPGGAFRLQYGAPPRNRAR